MQIDEFLTGEILSVKQQFHKILAPVTMAFLLIVCSDYYTYIHPSIIPPTLTYLHTLLLLLIHFLSKHEFCLFLFICSLFVFVLRTNSNS